MARVELTKSKATEFLLEMKNDEDFHPIIINHLLELHEYDIAGIFMLYTCWTNWKDGSWRYDLKSKKFTDKTGYGETLRKMLSVFYGRQILVKNGQRLELDPQLLAKYLASA